MALTAIVKVRIGGPKTARNEQCLYASLYAIHVVGGGGLALRVNLGTNFNAVHLRNSTSWPWYSNCTKFQELSNGVVSKLYEAV